MEYMKSSIIKKRSLLNEIGEYIFYENQWKGFFSFLFFSFNLWNLHLSVFIKLFVISHIIILCSSDYKKTSPTVHC